MELSQPVRCWARIKTAFEGYHRYPDAPEDVAFLRSLHRHLFGITVWIEQYHDNRDVEYIQVQRWLRAQLDVVKFSEHASCEDMARAIGEMVQRRFPGRRVRIEVAEDDENGALIEMESCEPATDLPAPLQPLQSE